MKDLRFRSPRRNRLWRRVVQELVLHLYTWLRSFRPAIAAGAPLGRRGRCGL